VDNKKNIVEKLKDFNKKQISSNYFNHIFLNVEKNCGNCGKMFS